MNSREKFPLKERLGASVNAMKSRDVASGRWSAIWTNAVVRQVLFLLGILALWQLASGPVIDPLFVSEPLSVFKQISRWVQDGTLLHATWATLWVSMVAFAVGCLAGILVGYVLASWGSLDRLLKPTMTALYTLPKLVLAPLFILWFGIDFEFRALFGAFIVFFFVYFNTYQGVKEVPEDLIKAIRLMGANRYQTAMKVVAPSALTWVATGLKISLPYAFTGVIVAEMLAGGQGLGALLRSSSDQFFAAGTFAALIVILFMAVSIDAIITWVVSRALVWKTAGGATDGGAA